MKETRLFHVFSCLFKFLILEDGAAGFLRLYALSLDIFVKLKFYEDASFEDLGQSAICFGAILGS